jgi:hypothetical protein
MLVRTEGELVRAAGSVSGAGARNPVRLVGAVLLVVPPALSR